MGGPDSTVRSSVLLCSCMLTTFSPYALSATLRLSICASSEFVSKVANDETLHTLELSVANFVDHCKRGQCKYLYLSRVVIWFYIPPVIAFHQKEGDTELPSCPSLLVTIEHRNSSDLDHCVSIMIRGPCSNSKLKPIAQFPFMLCVPDLASPPKD